MKTLGFLPILTLATLLFSPDLFAAESATARQVIGKAQIGEEDGKPKAIQTGDKVPVGSTVTTQPESLVILTLPSSSTIKVNPNSQIRVEGLGAQDTLELLKGGIFSKVQKHDQTPNKFRIKTKAAVMGVRGTEFFTSVEEGSARDKNVWMCVREGEVEVEKSNLEKVTVHAGEGIRVTAADPLPAPRPFEWTKNLNWNMDAKQGDLFDRTELPKDYKKLVDQDYD